MSTTILSGNAIQPSQLCFPWEICEQPVRQSIRKGQKPTAPSQRSLTPKQARTPLTPSTGQATIELQLPNSHGDRNLRLGEVRLGAVMLALLKRYGITDEEISAELSLIAAESSAATVC